MSFFSLFRNVFYRWNRLSHNKIFVFIKDKSKVKCKRVIKYHTIHVYAITRMFRSGRVFTTVCFTTVQRCIFFLIHSFIHSFIHSIVHLLIHSFIRPFIYLFIHSFLPSFVRSFVFFFVLWFVCVHVLLQIIIYHKSTIHFFVLFEPYRSIRP